MIFIHSCQSFSVVVVVVVVQLLVFSSFMFCLWHWISFFLCVFHHSNAMWACRQFTSVIIIIIIIVVDFNYHRRRCRSHRNSMIRIQRLDRKNEIRKKKLQTQALKFWNNNIQTWLDIEWNFYVFCISFFFLRDFRW